MSYDGEERRVNGERRGERNSFVLGWGKRRLEMHGLIPILFLLVLTAVVGLKVYDLWYAPTNATAAGVLATTTDRQHREILLAITRSNEEMVYTQLLTDREKASLRARLAVPRRFRENGDQ